jgi:hypothetical protein
MCDLRTLIKRLTEEKLHCGGDETAKDNAVIKA